MVNEIHLRALLEEAYISLIAIEKESPTTDIFEIHNQAIRKQFLYGKTVAYLDCMTCNEADRERTAREVQTSACRRWQQRQVMQGAKN